MKSTNITIMLIILSIIVFPWSNWKRLWHASYRAKELEPLRGGLFEEKSGWWTLRSIVNVQWDYSRPEFGASTFLLFCQQFSFHTDLTLLQVCRWYDSAKLKRWSKTLRDDFRFCVCKLLLPNTNICIWLQGLLHHLLCPMKLLAFYQSLIPTKYQSGIYCQYGI